MAQFILNGKSDLVMDLEVEQGGGSYGSGTGPSSLVVVGTPNDLVMWSQFKIKKTPVNIPLEEGLVSRRQGQPLCLVGYNTEYSGAIPLRELTMLATDVASPLLRPNVHQLMRSSAFALPVFANNGTTSTLTYADNTFPEDGADSLECALYQYVSDASRNRIDLTGGVSDLQITWEPQKPILFEALTGKAKTIGDPVEVAGVVAPVFALTPCVPFNSATMVLETLGSALVYPATSHIRKVVLRTKTNTFQVLDGRGEGGLGRAFNNPWEHAELDILVEELTPSALSFRSAWATKGTVIHFTMSVPGPTDTDNTLSMDLYGSIESIDESEGPGKEMLDLVKLKLLWSGGIGAVGNVNQVVFSSAAVP